MEKITIKLNCDKARIEKRFYEEIEQNKKKIAEKEKMANKKSIRK